MTLAEKVGQLLLVGFRGTEVDGNQELSHLIADLKIGGVILFQVDWTADQAPRNIVSAEQVRKLTAGIQKRAREAGLPPLLIAVDNEGGKVVRIPPASGEGHFPSHAELGSCDDVALTEIESRRIARALRAVGVNWNLAPVVDVAIDPENAIVKSGRSFGSDPEKVAAHARAFVRGHQAEGLLTALKHFPGHGSSRDDSHAGFVDVSKTARPDLERLPYRELIRERLADSIMTAHVFNDRLDSRVPATLSHATTTKLLREELGFDGVVVSDDLQMGAITQHYGTEDAAVLALQAGVDLLLLSNNWDTHDPTLADRVHSAVLRAIARGDLDPGAVDSSSARISALKTSLRAR